MVRKAHPSLGASSKERGARPEYKSKAGRACGTGYEPRKGRGPIRPHDDPWMKLPYSRGQQDITTNKARTQKNIRVQTLPSETSALRALTLSSRV